MKKNNQIITDFSKVTFLYYNWSDAYKINYEKLEQAAILKFKSFIFKVEPFFGDWHYFKDLDMNEDRPHWGLIPLRHEVSEADQYDFLEINRKAFLHLIDFWQKGITYITYLYKLYVHFNLSFSSIEFNFIDLYFSSLAAIDELISFLLENNQIVSCVESNLNKLHYLDLIINHIISYPDFVNLFFAWSNYSLKYKDKWSDLSSSLKVKEVLLAELSILSLDTLSYLSLNLPWTLEQYKQDADLRQEELSRAFRPIFENMLKVQKGENPDPNIPLLTPINIEDIKDLK